MPPVWPRGSPSVFWQRAQVLGDVQVAAVHWCWQNIDIMLQAESPITMQTVKSNRAIEDAKCFWGFIRFLLFVFFEMGFENLYRATPNGVTVYPCLGGHENIRVLHII